MKAEPLSQLDLYLPERPADEILTEKLSAAVEAFNAAQDSAQRVQLHGEIKRLRFLLRRPAERTP